MEDMQEGRREKPRRPHTRPKAGGRTHAAFGGRRESPYKRPEGEFMVSPGAGRKPAHCIKARREGSCGGRLGECAGYFGIFAVRGPSRRGCGFYATDAWRTA